MADTIISGLSHDRRARDHSHRDHTPGNAPLETPFGDAPLGTPPWERFLGSPCRHVTNEKLA
jgi:hypothetical protein